MRLALRLARRSWGRTSPNPMVGAVVVRDGLEAGRGRHRVAGGPHAEPAALAAAGDLARGATLYVTLEPCSTHGRTPPCTEAILAAGIRRVVIGGLDPNPKHAGRGAELLRRNGIEVRVGVLQAACERLNEAFFHWIVTGRPFVILKMAMTLDGKIATASGASRWITGEQARRDVQRLRQWADAIMVGAETVRRDDPELTVRTPRNWPRQPRKLVWSRRGALPRNYRIWQDPGNPPEFVTLRHSAAWLDFLGSLGSQDVTALLLEGGGELAGAALRAGAVNEIVFYVAPKILGGRGSRPVVGGPDPDTLAAALVLRDVTVKRLGDDLRVCGYVPN
ncbi:MAG: bifunctional diaminohydroxyphosphoribosylaminopyrimidine deaminase/5-amino-6-(5-phosphoribosylamino)uracil reductase RibD [Kiritimatiellaeota bacterium]|nr:bifunctional diaminohydroxyphosphoribosylaminopyrimidine deaminase/5-amino-6-(5-phosphoribosylamino)uracil reductase RibD [Kiritimatiellota bacterium]